jgi:hypothetical protein
MRVRVADVARCAAALQQAAGAYAADHCGDV